MTNQESLWREDLQSGGNPRITTSTGYELKELATVSRIEAYFGDPYQSYDVPEKFGEEYHRAPITAEVEECGKLRRLVCRIPNYHAGQNDYRTGVFNIDLKLR